MMFLKSVVFGAFVAAANADNLRTYHRHLSYDFIAGYRPDSSVTDHVSNKILTSYDDMRAAAVTYHGKIMSLTL